jgi:hypothetical protein
MSVHIRIGRRQVLAVALSLAGLAGGGASLAALNAVGLKGAMPVGGQAIAGLIGTLQSNWEWLIATGVGLVLVLLAGLMIFGSIRAADHLFRVIGGIMLILVVIPAVLA